jgi:hypothetical protein
MKLPRLRFTVWRMMIAVAVFAAAFAALAPWMEMYRDQWRKWREYLNTEMTWIESPVGEFYVKNSFEKYSANSLLKVSEPDFRDREGYYDRRRWWLGQGGVLGQDRVTVTPFGRKGAGGENRLTAAELAQVQQIIATLPPSNATPWQGDLLLVASFSEGSWVTKVYSSSVNSPCLKPRRRASLGRGKRVGIIRISGSWRAP